METEKTAAAGTLTAKSSKRITKWIVISSILLTLILIFFFALPFATGKASFGASLGIKVSDIIETCQGSTGWAMGRTGNGFFRIFAYILPVLWILSIVFAYVKKYIALILTIISTVFYVLLSVFSMSSANEAFRWGHLSLSIGFWLIITLSVATIALLSSRRK